MNNTFEQPAAYTVHDAGPRRYYREVGPRMTWTRTKLGKKLLTIMALYGLNKRDADLFQQDHTIEVSTDLHRVFKTDRELVQDRPDLDAAFASIAAGVAQWRMLWLSGWCRRDVIPFWAVTASETLIEPASKQGANLRDAYDVDVDLGKDTEIWLYGTGMHLTWTDKELWYFEGIEGAELTLPTTLLRGDGANLFGRSFGDSCSVEGDLAKALARYRIVSVRQQEADKQDQDDHVSRTILQLAVPVRTLEQIPEDVLIRAGITIPAGAKRDYPLWMMTSPEQLRSYRPRLSASQTGQT